MQIEPIYDVYIKDDEALRCPRVLKEECILVIERREV